MKRFLILSLLLSSITAFAGELANYEAIKTTILKGKSIRIAIDFDKCTPQQVSVIQPPSFGLGIFSPNEIIITGNGQIAASLLHFTLNDPHMPSKPLYQYARYTITPDNTINLATQALDATTFKPLSDGFAFNCKISTEAKVYS